MQKNILVCGMGVIGSIYALNLAKAGFAVTCLARGGRLASLKKKGLVIRNLFLENEESAKAEITDSVALGTEYDIIFIVVRSGQIMEVLEQLKEKRLAAKAVAVIGNNLENLEIQASVFGRKHFVAGFGAFGGYREEDSITYLDGRTAKKSSLKYRSNTTLGIIDRSSRPALELVKATLTASGCPVIENPDIQSWFLYHAALVFPLAGAIYSVGGGQERFCRTRDSIVLGVRACHECFRALRRLGFSIQPKSLKSLTAMPEWFLVRMLSKRMDGESARVAMFGHANAPGGHDEISRQAEVFDKIIRKAEIPLVSWDKLLPYFRKQDEKKLIADKSRTIRLRIW